MFEKIIIILFILSFILQFIYYIVIYSGVLFLKDPEGNEVSKEVSVIISTRNESVNLHVFLPLILNQNYKNFEVIVVNDRSDDNSKDILDKFRNEYSNLSVITISRNEKGATGKKYALTKAINNAKYEYLLFTDADCYPVSEFWIKSMIASYSEEKDIVLGYGAYETKKGFLNKLIRFDTVFIALQYFAFAKIGFTYMGVGRNLSYKKKLFVKHSGFSDHIHILSGDDDLHIKKISNRINTAISLNKNSITKSIPKEKFKDWIIQKRRHLTTGFHYKFIHKTLLACEPFSKLILYLAFIIGLIINKYVFLLMSVFIFKYIFQFMIIGLFAKKINEKKILIFIPIFDILIPTLNLFVLISNIFIKKKEWN